MATKPAGDLGAMAVTKTAAAEAVAFKPQTPAAAAGVPKGLTIKLDAALYGQLRQYCFDKERETGNRVTHQHVMVEALKAFLASSA